MFKEAEKTIELFSVKGINTTLNSTILRLHHPEVGILPVYPKQTFGGEEKYNQFIKPLLSQYCPKTNCRYAEYCKKSKECQYSYDYVDKQWRECKKRFVEASQKSGLTTLIFS